MLLFNALFLTPFPWNSQRYASGNMFGGRKTPFGASKPLFGGSTQNIGGAPSESPKPKKKSKIGSKTSSKRPSPDYGIPEEPIQNLDGLKKLIDTMPSSVLDSLDPQLKDLVDTIKSGGMDGVDPKDMSKALNSARRASEFVLHKSRGSMLRAATSTPASEHVEDSIDEKRELDEIAEKTIRDLMTMSDDDWKQAGIEKPDWSKPLTYNKLVEIDRLLGDRGVKTSDFDALMTPAELNAANPVIPNFEIDESSAEKATAFLMNTARARTRRLADRKSKKSKAKLDNQKLRPGDINRAMLDSLDKGDYQAAIDTFNDALQWDTSLLGFEPIDLEAINTLLNTFTSLGDFKAAERAFELIDRFQYTADVRTYNTFMLAGAEARDDRIVLKWYNKLLEAGLKADCHTYTALIAVYGKTGNEALALKYFEEMRATLPLAALDSTPYAQLIEMYGFVLNDLPNALIWAKQMITDNVARNEYTVDMIAKLHTKVTSERADVAAKRDAEPKSIQQMFISAYTSGDVKSVEKLWESMRYNKSHLTEGLWSARIQHAANTAKLDDAARIYNEMLDEGFSPSRITCSTMVQVFRRLGDLDKSQEALERSKTAPAGDASILNASTSGVHNPNPFAAKATPRLR